MKESYRNPTRPCVLGSETASRDERRTSLWRRDRRRKPPASKTLRGSLESLERGNAGRVCFEMCHPACYESPLATRNQSQTQIQIDSPIGEAVCPSPAPRKWCFCEVPTDSCGSPNWLPAPGRRHETPSQNGNLRWETVTARTRWLRRSNPAKRPSSTAHPRRPVSQTPSRSCVHAGASNGPQSVLRPAAQNQDPCAAIGLGHGNSPLRRRFPRHSSAISRTGPSSPEGRSPPWADLSWR